jgi:acetolactate synthase-1/2/3 large subunit
MQDSGASIIIERLVAHGVGVVAGMPGGANLPIYDALLDSGIAHVLVRHEQAAGFIAQGMARVGGRAGVCLATSGPGATNLVTALADARMDSVPLVAITGQVPTALIGTDAFQEVDTCAMVRPLVKHAEQVRRVEDVAAAIDRAFAIAEGGRPGPVLVDVPKDVQQAAAGTARAGQGAAPGAPDDADAAPAPTDAALAQVVDELSRARRPLLLVGGGAASSGASAALRKLVRRQQLPSACTLMGLGVLDPADPAHLGMLGMHGAPCTNLVLDEADLLLAVGLRFDDRATGKLAEFCPRARTVHVDIDARELGKLRAAQLPIRADARAFAERLLERAPSAARPDWSTRVAQLRAEHPLLLPAGRDPRCAIHLLGEAAEALAPETVVTTDVGQHQMWVAQLIPFERPRQLLTSGGLGTMGFGLPAAIGAALAGAPRVLCVTGDGSLLLNAQELSTLAELGLDVTILLLDNRHLGLVHQQQSLFYRGRLSASRLTQPTDFVALARSMGVDGYSLEGAARPFDALRDALARPGPRLIHAPVRVQDQVLPMVPPGGGNREMLRLRDAGARVSRVQP